ncbi:MAG TPA: hypothetical protein VN754_07535 [Candidatus Binataceae bacterium]|nr:hypothetical protein [Candidatus Binataceae bacterium]
MKRTTLERQAETIERWKSRSGVTGRDYVPANSGATRSPSKRALLQAIDDAARERGARPRFASDSSAVSKPTNGGRSFISS